MNAENRGSGRDRPEIRARSGSLIDLSAPIVPSPPETPALWRTDIDYLDHAGGAAEAQALFGVPPRLLRDGEGWARETFTSFGTHNSTHVDAPWHYNSTVGGERAQTIDELPLDWFFGPGVVVDFTDKADGEAVTADEMSRAIDEAGHELRERDIVLVRTGRDAFYGDPEYASMGPGVTAEATRWLFERGVRVMGIDAWGWDRPLHLQAEEAIGRDESGIFWEAHQADLPYSQIERLVNLGSLPPTGFRVACFPLRLAGASAAPARVVGILD
ncbi:cyclase family protein [Rubrobacter marinus]|uniref:Cyclase family protein n=1 Tax=Rubrobacter marinus TaxID=2653852 RepID=A0A6G8Q1D4_9ACTN|nr:cyclase family protein [Rubrobacter marinus]QIN80127.1 cyclase family protein [Rubrobacter marinus]